MIEHIEVGVERLAVALRFAHPFKSQQVYNNSNATENRPPLNTEPTVAPANEDSTAENNKRVALQKQIKSKWDNPGISPPGNATFDIEEK